MILRSGLRSAKAVEVLEKAGIPNAIYLSLPPKHIDGNIVFSGKETSSFWNKKFTQDYLKDMMAIKTIIEKGA